MLIGLSRKGCTHEGGTKRGGAICGVPFVCFQCTWDDGDKVMTNQFTAFVVQDNTRQRPDSCASSSALQLEAARDVTVHERH